MIIPRHVDARKLEKTVWCLSTFHAYVSYHVKASLRFWTFFHPIKLHCYVQIVHNINHVSLYFLSNFLKSNNILSLLLQCSEGFMHTRMRRRVESLIQVICYGLTNFEFIIVSYSHSFSSFISFIVALLMKLYFLV